MFLGGHLCTFVEELHSPTWPCQLQTSFRLDQSDLFECTVLLDEIGDTLAIAATGKLITEFLKDSSWPSLTLHCFPELPSLLPVAQLVEALLRCRTGSHLITRLVANMPNSFDKGGGKYETAELFYNLRVTLFMTAFDKELTNVIPWCIL